MDQDSLVSTKLCVLVHHAIPRSGVSVGLRVANGRSRRLISIPWHDRIRWTLVHRAVNSTVFLCDMSRRVRLLDDLLSLL